MEASHSFQYCSRMWAEFWIKRRNVFVPTCKWCFWCDKTMVFLLLHKMVFHVRHYVFAISIPTLIFPIFTIIFNFKFLLFQYLHWYFGTDMLLLPNDSLISCGNIFQDRLLSSNFKYSSVIIENEELQRVKLRTFHFQPIPICFELIVCFI